MVRRIDDAARRLASASTKNGSQSLLGGFASGGHRRGTCSRTQQGARADQGYHSQTGAVIPNASVTVINIDTAVSVTRTTNKAGDFNVSPLQAGHYYVEITAKGFQKLVQEQVSVDALQTVGLNLKLTVGADSQTITITDAPPMLDTQDASLGGTIENELYAELPLSMGGAPRDPTAVRVS